MSNLSDLTTPSPGSGRNFWKCDFCRKKKRKCEPEIRDWEGRGQKCNPCVSGGQPCGPNTFHDGRPQVPQTPLPANLPVALHNYALQDPSSSSTSFDLSSAFLTSSSTCLDLYNDWSSSPPNDSRFGAGLGPSSSQRGGGSFRTSEPPGTGRKSGTKSRDLIRAKLNELSSICDLFRAVKNRLCASVKSQTNPKSRFHFFEEIQSLLSNVLHWIRSQFQSSCADIQTQVDQLHNEVCKELFLTRLFDKIQRFLDIALDEVAPQGSDYTRIEELHRNVAQSIIELYDRIGEPSEADDYRLRLADLRARHHVSENYSDFLQEQQTFLRMSKRVSENFQALDLPRSYGRTLSMTNAFPAAHLAIYHGRRNIARTLLEQDSSRLLELDLLSRCAAHLGAETSDESLLHASSSQGLRIAKQRDVYGMTPLCIAAYIGDLGIFRALHEAGHDLSVRDLAGRTLLCIASGAGHTDIVRYLLARGVNPTENYNLEQGRVARHYDVAHAYSALHAAAAGGHQDIAVLLLKYQASSVWQSYDRTPSQEATAYGHHELAALLLRAEEDEGQKLRQPGVVPDIRIDTTPATPPNGLAAPGSTASPSSQSSIDPTVLQKPRSIAARSRSNSASITTDNSEPGSLSLPASNQSQKRTSRESSTSTSRPPSRNVRSRLDLS